MIEIKEYKKWLFEYSDIPDVGFDDVVEYEFMDETGPDELFWQWNKERNRK